ncbi:MAG: cyclic nucleotide-binding domain-containing protein [Burkholderiales bacterium]
MFNHLINEMSRYAQLALESPSEMMALISVIAAGLSVLVSSFVKTMIPLRGLAIASNFGFVAYGALHPSYPMLMLHALLLPINIFRLAEMVRLTKHVARVRAEAAHSGVWLKPYMRAKKHRAGTVLFRKGDMADRLYMLAEGRIELVEINSSLLPGQIFGEIAFFSPDRRRRLTARCADKCTVLSIDESTVKQLYYQNPAFGFNMIELVAARFSADVDRLNAELASERKSAQAQADVATKVDMIE